MCASATVRAQHKLITEKFALSSLALIVGGSMGAQQTYEWAVRYPDMVRRAAPIAGTARNTSHVSSSPKRWLRRSPRTQVSTRAFSRRQHAKMWAVMGWNSEFFQQNRHRALGFSSLDDFVSNFMYGYFSVMDPNDLLCQAWKWQRGDVSRHTGGDLRAALGRIKAKTFVMPMASDMFFPPADCQAEWRLIFLARMPRHGLVARMDAEDRFWYTAIPAVGYAIMTAAGVAFAMGHPAGCGVVALAMGGWRCRRSQCLGHYGMNGRAASGLIMQPARLAT